MKYTLNLAAKEFSSERLVLVSAFEKTVPAKGKTKESKVIPFQPVFLSKDVFVLGVYRVVNNYHFIYIICH